MNLSAAQEERLMDIANGEAYRRRKGHRIATTRALRSKGMLTNEIGYGLTHAGAAYVNAIRERRRAAEAAAEAVRSAAQFCSKQCRKRLSPPRDCPYCARIVGSAAQNGPKP